MTIIRCMVPEIWSMWQTEFLFILDHFLPFYPPTNLKNQKHEKQNWYWYEAWRTEFFVILDHFLSFHPPPPGDIIILQKCTKYHDRMVYCSIDMARNEFNYFSFWAIFCPFTPLTAQKIKNLKKNMKKTLGDIIILHTCTKNHDHMLYCSWDMAHDRCNCCFSFWAVSALSLP